MQTDPFAGILPFVHVADERSFRRAAERLGVTTAAVSKAIAKLEGELGVTLLVRTSRHVALTPEGEAFLERCRHAVEEVRAGRELVAQAQRVPQGVVKLTMPFILGRVVAPILARVGQRHPRVSFQLHLTDRFVRLAEEQIDVAIRLGELEASSLVARRLRTPSWVTVASPAYLARHPAPKQVADLARHACLKFVTPRGAVREWTFRSGASATPSSFVADHGEVLLDAAIAGAGIFQALDFMVEAPLADGRLVEVLADEREDGPRLHALALPRRSSSPKVRVVLDALIEGLGAP